MVEVKSENPNKIAFFEPSIFLILALKGAFKIYAMKKMAIISEESFAWSSASSFDESVPL